MRAEKPFIADISIIQPTKEQWQVIFNLFIENKVLSYGEFLFLESAENTNYVQDDWDWLHGPRNTKMIQSKKFNIPLPFTNKTMTIRGWGKEAVYNGAKDVSTLVRTAGKMGTYNYFRFAPVHAVVDMAPWLMWGNTRETTFLEAF